MAHAGHGADAGPSTDAFMDNFGTGLSTESGAFVAAHCSPFTHPLKLEVEPKVPDPSNHQRTCTAYLTAHFQLPMIAMTATRGDQLILLNPDPLAQLPVVWARSNTSVLAVTSTDPNMSSAPSWAQAYEDADLGDFLSQAKSLADNSLRHRVVGAGLRAWVGQNTTIERGIIEGGQFDIATTRQLTTPTAAQLIAWRDNTNSRDTLNAIVSNGGCFAEALYNKGITTLRQSIRDSRTQKKGLLQAERGCSVRWSNEGNWNFIPTINRGLICPLLPTYYNGFPNSDPLADPITGSTHKHMPVVHLADFGTQSGATAPANGLYDVNDLQVLKHNNLSTVGWTASQLAGLQGTNTWRAGTMMSCDMAQNYIAPFWINDGSRSRWTDPNQNFQSGLYIDVQGCSPDQYLDIQIVYHVEYVPRENSMNIGRPSPIDLNFDTIKNMVANDQAFPVVVSGHSFFSSLWHGIKKAGSVIGKVLTASSKVASMIPIPEVQGFAAGAGAIGGTLGSVFM